MADCCSTINSTDKPAEKRMLCPQSQTESYQVPFKTLLQHLKKPWQNELVEQQYYYCDDPECEVIYFGEDNSVIKQADIRTQVGIKRTADVNSLICYCFDISYAEARRNKMLMQFVTDKTIKQDCSCKSQNPSGRCCLKDFKRLNISSRYSKTP